MMRAVMRTIGKCQTLWRVRSKSEMSKVKMEKA
jgi:hypothetical protein